MAYSHFKNSKASTKKYEPIYLNTFEVLLTPPAGISPGVGNGGGNLMLEHVKKVTGLDFDKNPGVVEQNYKFSKRRYAGAKPETTTVDITIDFEINLNENNSMYIFDTLRKWSNIVYDPMTGAMGLKSEYSGSALISIPNKKGDIFRKIRIPNFWPMSAINAMELDYQSTELYSISLTFAGENYEDVWV